MLRRILRHKCAAFCAACFNRCKGIARRHVEVRITGSQIVAGGQFRRQCLHRRQYVEHCGLIRKPNVRGTVHCQGDGGVTRQGLNTFGTADKYCPTSIHANYCKTSGYHFDFESAPSIWYNTLSMSKPLTPRRGGRSKAAAGDSAPAPAKETTAKSKPAAARGGKAPDLSSYSLAVRYLYDRVDFERMRVIRYDENVFKLDRMRALLAQLGNPHEQVKMVHVAGTVGKGSTVAMIANMLQGCGYAVGQYTSPHLMDVRERITINGQMISKADFTECMRAVSVAATKIPASIPGEPTFFELMTAAAFRYFAEQAVDIAVIEVGLGGRLDSTNVITPEVSVITTIDYDHTHILGNTLAKIAREKAGIFKKGVPALSFEQHEDVERTLRECAEKVGAPFKIINKDIEFSTRFGSNAELGPHTRVCLLTETSQFMHIPVPLAGEHQAGNCALALATIDLLKGRGFQFPEVALHEGLSATKMPGRMELVWDSPRILVDGAHNAAALSALMRCVGAHVPYDSMVCIFGCCEDKDVSAMLDRVALGGDKIIFTRAKGNARAADPEDLQREFAERSGKMNQVAANLQDAIDLATRAVGRDDLIVITGSFYLVGEAKKYLAEVDRKQR